MMIEKYFEMTKRVAMNSEFNRVHVGCIAIYKGKMIGSGFNSEKTHPMQYHYNRYRLNDNVISTNLLPKIHAEIMCISSIKNQDIDFKKVKLFIYKIRNDQPFGNARPCPACMNAIMDMGIRNIYYTTDVGYAHEYLT